MKEKQAWRMIRELWKKSVYIKGEYVVLYEESIHRGMCGVIWHMYRSGKISRETSRQMLKRINSTKMFLYSINTYEGMMSRVAFCTKAIKKCSKDIDEG